MMICLSAMLSGYCRGGEWDQDTQSWWRSGRHELSKPLVQPEPPALLVKRLKPRVEFDDEIRRLEGEIDGVTVPALELRDASVGEAVERINGFIRAHNERKSAFQVPPVKFLKLEIPDSAEPAGGGEARITLSLPPGSLGDRINYICELSCQAMVPEKDEILLVSSAFPLWEVLRRNYIIPESIDPDGRICSAFLEKSGAFVSGGINKYEFDAKTRVLKLSLGSYGIDLFESWYARELMKRGYGVTKAKIGGVLR